MNQSATAAPAAVASEVLRAYLDAYKRRLRQRPNAPFKAPLQNALLALLAHRVALASDSRAERANALKTIEASTRAILEKQSEHGVATDISGYVWAAAYGSLPLPQPPLPQIERVLDSGAAGGVTGMIGVSWRALFLATAWPLFPWEQRQRAAKELERRSGYIASRLGNAVADRDGETLATNQFAQTAAAVAELGERLENDELRVLARRAADRAIATQRDDGSIPDAAAASAPTGHFAQFIFGVTGVAPREAPERALDYLLRNRVDTDESLLRRDDSPGAPAEMSPWAPLALAAQLGDPSAVLNRPPRWAGA